MCENRLYALFLRIFNNIYHFSILDMAQFEMLLGKSSYLFFLHIKLNFILVFKLFYTRSILINFNYFYRGVRQGKKGHHENKTTYYQSQYRDSTVENHIYDEPRQPRGQTPVEDRQELTVYESIL